jgi:hypothetical protein
MRESHDKIVEEIQLIAEKLKQEGIISDHDNKQKKIKISKDLAEIRIKPDRILHLSNGNNILVEVVNPEEPKRFIGELIYAKILIHYNKIEAAMFFVLYPQEHRTHRRSLSQIHALSFLRLPKGSRTVTWAGENEAYRSLKDFVERLKIQRAR